MIQKIKMLFLTIGTMALFFTCQKEDTNSFEIHEIKTES